MLTVSQKAELLAPAGNFEKLQIAAHYGADAVYLGGKDFSLRNFSGNFTDTEMVDAITFAHLHKVKVYLACNIYSRNHEQKETMCQSCLSMSFHTQSPDKESEIL